MPQKPCARQETLAGRNYREYQPLIPILGMLVLGILTDYFFLTPDSVETFISVSVWGWSFFLLLTLGAAFFFVTATQKELRTINSAVFVPQPQAFNSVPLSMKDVLLKKMKRKSLWGNLFLLLAFTALGGLFHHIYWNFYLPTDAGLRAGDPFSLECVEGKVVRPPRFIYPCDEIRFSGTEKDVVTVLNLRVHARMAGTRWQKATGNLIVRILGRVRDVHAGDVFRMSGRMTQLSDAMNPGAFSPRTYYRQQRILAVLRVPAAGNPKLIFRPRIWGVFRVVEYLRDGASAQLERFLTPETRSMAEALILGCREEVSSEDLNQMLETGTIHIMAISGLHVGLLAGGFLLGCRILGVNRFGTMLTVLFCVWLYVLVSGARPPALRAGVIVTISTLGFWLSRTQSHLNSLAAAGLIVLFLNPTALFSTGTQLSFLAVGTLIFTPFLRCFPNQQPQEMKPEENEMELAWEYLLVPTAPHRKIWRRLGKQALIRFANLLYSSFQMTIVLLPLVVRSFHVAAFVGIFLNILLWAPLTIAMMSGAGVVLFGNLPWFGPLLGWLCSASLSVMDSLIHWGAQIPGHCLWMRGTPAFWNFILYLFLILWAIFPNLRFQKRSSYGLFFLLMLLLLLPFWLKTSNRKGELTCSFISVSHGLSILLQFPDGKTLLYDAGQFAPSEYPARTISEFLWNSGVHHLDAVVVSHPDMDHYNALPGILERFSTGVIFISPQMLTAVQDQNPNSPARIEEAISEKEVDESSDSKSSDWRERQKQAKAETAAMLQNLRQSIHSHGIPIQTLMAGDRIPFSEGCALTVLHPSRASLEAEPEKTNSNSLVLLLEFEGFRFLLTGDLAPPGLGHLLAQKPVRCDVVLAPHHGGKTCCTPELATWCLPKHFVICEAFKNQQERTTEIFAEKGARVYHTGRDGAVIFRVRKGTLTVFTRNEWKEWHQ